MRYRRGGGKFFPQTIKLLKFVKIKSHFFQGVIIFSKICKQLFPRKKSDTLSETIQNKAKRFAKQQRSNVDNALASVYCYCLRLKLIG